MKLALTLLALSIAPYSFCQSASSEVSEQKVTIEQLHEAIRGVDAAVVIYSERNDHSKVLVRDTRWIEEFLALIKSLRIEPQPAVFSIMETSSVQLYREEDLSLQLWWATEERLILFSKEWRLELKVGKDVFVKFQNLCRAKGQKKPNQALEPTTTAVTDRAGARSAPAAVVAHL
jgi:hypothetical protein